MGIKLIREVYAPIFLLCQDEVEKDSDWEGRVRKRDSYIFLIFEKQCDFF